MIDLAAHVTAVTDAWKIDDPEMTISEKIIDNLIEIIRETGININPDGTMDASVSTSVQKIIPDIDLLDLNY